MLKIENILKADKDLRYKIMLTLSTDEQQFESM